MINSGREKNFLFLKKLIFLINIYLVQKYTFLKINIYFEQKKKDISLKINIYLVPKVRFSKNKYLSSTKNTFLQK